MQCIFVRIRIYRDRRDTHAARGLYNSAGDFATVRDQYFFEHASLGRTRQAVAFRGSKGSGKPMRNASETRPGIFTIPQRLGGALFRIHIESGISVSLGMAVVGLGTAVLFGRNMAILAATGALCASVVDQPGALAIKARMFALDIAGTTMLTILAILAAPSPWLLGLLVAAMSFVTGLISGYGRRAIGLGVAAVLSLLFGTATIVGTLPPLWHTAVFAAGGIAYAYFALLMGIALDDRNRGMFLGEAVRAFAGYVEAKAELYNPRTRPRQALQSLIEAHAAFTERLQAARDMIFTGQRTQKRLRWMAALIALLDAFDMMLSSDADIETLRQSAHHHLMRRLRALVADIAEDTQELALALVTPGADVACSDHESQLQAIAEEIVRLETAHDEHNEPLAISAFRSTQHKLQQAVLHLKRLTDAVESRDAEKMPVPKLDLTAFVQRESLNPRLLLSQMSSVFAGDALCHPPDLGDGQRICADDCLARRRAWRLGAFDDGAHHACQL